MASKLNAVATAMDKLHHGLDSRADKLLKRIEGVDQRADIAFGKAHMSLDDRDTELNAVDSLMGELERVSNNAPLPDSPTDSVGETAPQAEKKT